LRFLQRVLTRRLTSSPSAFDAHGSLRLNLLSCPTDPLLDLVFVHGLGGGSTQDLVFPKMLPSSGPKAWLPRKSGFRNIRIPFVWVRCGLAVHKSHSYYQRPRFWSSTAGKASKISPSCKFENSKHSLGVRVDSRRSNLKC